MKYPFLILTGLFLIGAPAFAAEDQDFQECVKRVTTPDVSPEKAAYFCKNEWLEYRASDTAEEQQWRLEFLQDQAAAHDEIMAHQHDEE